MRLSAAQHAAVRDIEAICSLESDSRRLRQRVAARLFRLIHWNAACFATIDPWTLLITDDYSPDISPDLQAQAAYNEYLIDDVHKITEMAHTGTLISILSRAPRELQETSHRLRTILPAMDCRYEVRGVCLADGQCWGAFAIFRSGAAPDFSSAEAALLQAVTAPLAAGLRRTAHRLGADLGTSPRPGVLILDPRNQTLAASDTARQWLDELRPFPARSGDELPYVVHQVAARVQGRLTGPSLPARRTPEPYARVQTRTGQWVAVHGSPVGNAQSPEKSTAVVIEAAPVSDIAEMLMLAYALTPREREVLQRVIAGIPSSAIASQLHISVNTVQDHLKSLFAKVGVRSRGQLVARVLGEHYLPNLG
ncbi:MAG TPA: helix-turn-helix transcriptional regulator [Streptosporangiaceae bacterium]|nr:helix-turn-helix transcriptional regulator [Streptosporangiaceae bacterium]